MADPVPTAPVATPAPAPSKSVGQEVDAELAVIKARVAVLEADAKTAWADVVAWVKAQWPHFVTWAGTAAVAVKAFGVHIL